MRETIWHFLITITPTLNLLLSTTTGLIALFRLFIRKGLWIRLSGLLICFVCCICWISASHQIGDLFVELLQLLGAFAAVIVICTFYIEERDRRKNCSISFSSATPPKYIHRTSTIIPKEAYCLNSTCRTKVPMNHPQRVKTKKGGWRLKDTCPYCQKEISCFTS